MSDETDDADADADEDDADETDGLRSECSGEEKMDLDEFDGIDRPTTTQQLPHCQMQIIKTEPINGSDGIALRLIASTQSNTSNEHMLPTLTPPSSPESSSSSVGRLGGNNSNNSIGLKAAGELALVLGNHRIKLEPQSQQMPIHDNANHGLKSGTFATSAVEMDMASIGSSSPTVNSSPAQSIVHAMGTAQSQSASASPTKTPSTNGNKNRPNSGTHLSRSTIVRLTSTSSLLSMPSVAAAATLTTTTPSQCKTSSKNTSSNVSLTRFLQAQSHGIVDDTTELMVATTTTAAAAAASHSQPASPGSMSPATNPDESSNLSG